MLVKIPVLVNAKSLDVGAELTVIRPPVVKKKALAQAITVSSLTRKL